MKTCPKCELNYIKDDEDFCSLCEENSGYTKKCHNKAFYKQSKTDLEKAKDTLKSIGASWAICYLYYKYINHQFLNYKLANDYAKRQSSCDNNEKYIIQWLIDTFEKMIES